MTDTEILMCICPDCGGCEKDHTMCGSGCICFEEQEEDYCSCHQGEINIYCQWCF